MDSVGSEYLFYFRAAIVGALVGAFGLVVYYVLRLFSGEENAEKRNQIDNKSARSTAEKVKRDHQSEKSSKSNKKSQEKKWSNKGEKQTFADPWLVKSLKGHTGEVLDVDFSSNNKYIVSCGDDRTVFIWDFKDITHGEHRFLRVNIDYDFPTFVKWSPDSKAFIIHKYHANCIEVYKVEKKKDGWLGPITKVLTFPKVHEEDVIGLAIASNGKYIMTCSNKTDLVIWDLKGNILAREDTYLMSTTCAKISPCSKFVAASGFAPDAKVWEVIFNKSGEFQEMKRVFDLSGHTSGIYDVAFDVDSSHMATVSKDGSWRLYDTKIEYKKGEDPHFKISGQYQKSGNHALIALSPNAEVVVIATANSLSFYRAHDGKLDTTIENVYKGRITAMKFDSTGKYLITTGERQIRVFLNITGVRRDLEVIEEKLKQNQTSATRERLEQQKSEAIALLESHQ